MMSIKTGFVPVIPLKGLTVGTTVSRSRVNWMAAASTAGRLRELAAGTRRGAAATPEARTFSLRRQQRHHWPPLRFLYTVDGFVLARPTTWSSSVNKSSKPFLTLHFLAPFHNLHYVVLVVNQSTTVSIWIYTLDLDLCVAEM
jgi:hypothetical protein